MDEINERDAWRSYVRSRSDENDQTCDVRRLLIHLSDGELRAISIFMSEEEASMLNMRTLI